MKITCTQENLNQGLGIVSRLVGTRTSLPVLNNILLKTEKGRLKFQATDLEIGISTYIRGKVEKEGGITCPTRLLNDFVGTNTDKTIQLETDKTTLYLKSDHFQAHIKGIDESEFPLIPVVKGKTISISAQLLTQAIEQTVFATALDETRPVLSGVLFNFSPQGAKIVATDSYRLAEKSIPLEKNFLNQQVIVPSRALSEVARISGGSEVVEVCLNENQVQFQIGETQVVSRLIEGAFPDYQSIIPTTFQTTLIASTQSLSNAIKMASFFAREVANNIKLKVNPSGIEVSAVSPQIGDNLSSVSGEVKGKELEIAFNAKFILEVLATLGTDKASFKFSGPLSPGVITPHQSKDYLYLIMPLKIEE